MENVRAALLRSGKQEGSVLFFGCGGGRECRGKGGEEGLHLFLNLEIKRRVLLLLLLLQLELQVALAIALHFGTALVDAEDRCNEALVDRIAEGRDEGPCHEAAEYDDQAICAQGLHSPKLVIFLQPSSPYSALACRKGGYFRIRFRTSRSIRPRQPG